MRIGLLTKKDGKTIIENGKIETLTLAEVCEIAEEEWFSGRADFVRVTAEGETYCEFED